MSESSEDYSDSDIDYVLDTRNIKKPQQSKGQAEIEKEKQKEIENNKKEVEGIYEKLLRISTIIGDLETIKFLIETHKLNKPKLHQLLHNAFYYGHYDISKYLLEHGADVNTVNKELTAILHTGNTEMFEYLLDKGANPLVRDEYGEIPLSDENYDKVVEYARQLMKEEITKNKK